MSNLEKILANYDRVYPLYPEPHPDCACCKLFNLKIYREDEKDLIKAIYQEHPHIFDDALVMEQPAWLFGEQAVMAKSILLEYTYSAEYLQDLKCVFHDAEERVKRNTIEHFVNEIEKYKAKNLDVNDKICWYLPLSISRYVDINNDFTTMYAFKSRFGIYLA